MASATTPNNEILVTVGVSEALYLALRLRSSTPATR